MTNRQSVDARAACAFRARASSGTAGTLDGAWISLQFFSGRPLEVVGASTGRAKKCAE